MDGDNDDKLFISSEEENRQHEMLSFWQTRRVSRGATTDFLTGPVTSGNRVQRVCLLPDHHAYGLQEGPTGSFHIYKKISEQPQEE